MRFISKRRFSFASFVISIFLSFIVLWRILLSGSAAFENKNTDLLTCDDFKHLKISSLLGEGWTKRVYNGTWRGVGVAVKVTNDEGHALQLCHRPREECISLLRQSLLKEKSVLQTLKHPNIVKLYGFCFPGLSRYSSVASNGTLLVELGEPVTSVALLQKDFGTRIKLAQDLCRLLLYLGTYPQGGILVPDLRLQQLVISGRHLKLADVDDVEFADGKCLSDTDCVKYAGEGGRVAGRVACRNSRCTGLSDSMNVWRACRGVLPYLLAYESVDGRPSASSVLAEAIEDVLKCRDRRWSSFDLREAVSKVQRFYYDERKR